MAIFRGEGGPGDATNDAANAAIVAQAAATAAQTSASNAATSASAASSSASSASSSATNAASSAASAAASYDSFDDRYLGAKSSAPSVDNDGNTLLVGALYWNTSTNLMYSWSGSAWNSIVSGGTGTVLSVGLSAPTGFTVSGSPVTSSGTLALGFSAGYSLPTTTSQSNWDTAYSWGNHASAGYATLTGVQTLTNKTLTNPTINGFTGNTDVINIGSGQFYKDATGKVGLGTTSPSYKLDIQNAGTFTGMSIGNTTTSGLTNLFIYNTANTLTYGVSPSGSYMSYTGSGPLSFSAGGSDLFVFTQAGAFGVGGANYGTSGQVLTSQGSSSAPIWSTVSSGGMTLLGTLTTTSGSSQTLSSLTLTGYKQLYIVFEGVSASSTSAVLRMTDPNSTNLQIGTFSTTNAALKFTGIMTLDLGSGVFTCVGYRGAAATGVSSGDASNSVFGGISTYSTSSTSITFTVSTGSFDLGAIDIYGVK